MLFNSVVLQSSGYFLSNVLGVHSPAVAEHSCFLYREKRRAKTTETELERLGRMRERDYLIPFGCSRCVCVRVCARACVCVCFLFSVWGRHRQWGGVKATDKTERENRKREIGEGSLQLWQLLCDLWGVACGSVSDPKTEGWWMTSSIPLSLSLLKSHSLSFLSTKRLLANSVLSLPSLCVLTLHDMIKWQGIKMSSM